MKKRVFSLLLSLCLVLGLFAGLPAAAWADGDTITYTLENGDTVSRVCERLGIDFNANKEWIMKTNNISNFTTLAVGRTLTLPAPGKVLTWVAPASTTTTTTAATTTTATTTTTSASGVPTVQYTLQAGDYLIRVCSELGIDYKANEAWIMQANNITNPNALKAGRTLILPAPGTTPPLSTATTGTTATNLSTTTTNTTATTASAGLLAGDTVSKYLISYVVKSGDTLFNICQAYGAKMDEVQSLNGIKNAASIAIGKTLLIPTATAPTSGSFLKVVAHKVVSGDTMLGICSSYGISYEANMALLQNLNQNANLNAIKVNQTLLIPVPATASVGTGTGTGTGSTGVPLTTTTPGVTIGKYYTFNLTGTTNGTYALTVNGQSINSANAGQTVHVVTTPDHGYKLDRVTVYSDSTNTAIEVDTSNNFVMPESNVRVTVSFVADPSMQPHLVYNSSVTQRNVIALVNGYNITSVEPGQTVKVVLNELPAGYAVDKICVSTVNPTSLNEVVQGTLDASTLVAVGADYSFVMPTADVFVTVVLKAA